ncbi:hypothetical protein [Nocardia sp. NPDC056000]|uniref:hypothetical protein n=1 Tax=Nocardia sp. NPDC056000 TaxID=3345674 RepID=UPI0035DD7D84
MSHQLATQAAGSSRRAAQVLRYGAIVTAGMASIGLTVAAGSYIANQMADAQKSGTIVAAPGDRHATVTAPGNVTAPVDNTPVADNIGLTAFFTPHVTENPAPLNIPATRVGTTTETTRAAKPEPIAGQLRLGGAYVGAAVVPVQRNSVSLTLDTNVFATIADLVLHTPIGETLGIGSDPTANTQLRTDVDTHSGEVTVTLSDPAIGRYGVQLARHNTPAAATVPNQAAGPSQVVTPNEAGAQQVSPGTGAESGRTGGPELTTV